MTPLEFKKKALVTKFIKTFKLFYSDAIFKARIYYLINHEKDLLKLVLDNRIEKELYYELLGDYNLINNAINTGLNAYDGHNFRLLTKSKSISILVEIDDHYYGGKVIHDIIITRDMCPIQRLKKIFDLIFDNESTFVNNNYRKQQEKYRCKHYK